MTLVDVLTGIAIIMLLIWTIKIAVWAAPYAWAVFKWFVAVGIVLTVIIIALNGLARIFG